MRRIKLLKYEASCNYYGDYAESNNTCFSSSSPWLELEDDKLQELEGAVQKANALNKRIKRTLKKFLYLRMILLKNKASLKLKKRLELLNIKLKKMLKL